MLVRYLQTTILVLISTTIASPLAQANHRHWGNQETEPPERSYYEKCLSWWDQYEILRRMNLATHGMESPPTRKVAWPFPKVRPPPAFIDEVSQDTDGDNGLGKQEDRNPQRNQPQSQEEVARADLRKRWLRHEQICYEDAILVEPKPAKRYYSYKEAVKAGILKYASSLGPVKSSSVSPEAGQEQGKAQTDNFDTNHAVLSKPPRDGVLSRFNQGVRSLRAALLKVDSSASSVKIKLGFTQLNPGLVPVP